MAFETIAQPTTYAERLAIAERTRDEFELRCTIVVDGMDDRSRAFFGDQPNSLFIVGPDSRVRLKQPWADPDELSVHLDSMLPTALEDLAKAASTEKASLRTRVAAALVAKNSEARTALLRDWSKRLPPKLSEHEQTDADRLRFALKLATENPVDLPRILAEGRAAFRLDTMHLGEEPPPTDRALALAATLAPMLEHCEGKARASLMKHLQSLVPSDGRGQRWLRSIE